MIFSFLNNCIIFPVSHINNSCPWDQIVELSIVEHFNPLLVYHFFQPFSDIPSLSFKWAVNLIIDQKIYVFHFVLSILLWFYFVTETVDPWGTKSTLSFDTSSLYSKVNPRSSNPSYIAAIYAKPLYKSGSISNNSSKLFLLLMRRFRKGPANLTPSMILSRRDFARSWPTNSYSSAFLDWLSIFLNAGLGISSFLLFSTNNW